LIDPKMRTAQVFSAGAQTYDDAASVQRLVADRFARCIQPGLAEPPMCILEIGCGTGFSSKRLVEAFPGSELLFTDISSSMLRRCRSRLGEGHRYQVLDGERPTELAGPFDLIASSLAFQWFTDLRGGLQRLSGLLAPGGRLLFATLGDQTFLEWRQAHADRGLPCGALNYPSAKELPWPVGFNLYKGYGAEAPGRQDVAFCARSGTGAAVQILGLRGVSRCTGSLCALDVA
jgi:malonyl-CoA O-methyltransferase